MRNTVLNIVLLCLSLAVYATANNLQVGQREEGDVLVSNRIIFKPPIPFVIMTARLGAHAPGHITFVNVTNAPGYDSTFAIIKGGVGNTSVLVAAIGERGRGMRVRFQVYGTLNDTTPAPTEPSTTITTEEPTGTEGSSTTEAPVTTEPPMTTAPPATTEAPVTTEESTPPETSTTEESTPSEASTTEESTPSEASTTEESTPSEAPTTEESTPSETSTTEIWSTTQGETEGPVTEENTEPPTEVTSEEPAPTFEVPSSTSSAPSTEEPVNTSSEPLETDVTSVGTTEIIDTTSQSSESTAVDQNGEEQPPAPEESFPPLFRML